MVRGAALLLRSRCRCWRRSAAVSELTGQPGSQRGLLQLNRRVLVIDDNAAIHADFRKVLNGSPVDGDAALDLLESELLGGAAPSNTPHFDLDVAFQGEEGVRM